MRLPLPLLRNNRKSHKNDFGHVLAVAGSPSMLGAAAIVGISAMRAGAGLTTIAVAKSLNSVLQEKISPVIMTMPLPETRQGTLALNAFKILSQNLKKFDVLALGPGLSRDNRTQKLICKLIASSTIPLVIDGDALTAVANDLTALTKTTAVKILTPHIGEMARLTGLNPQAIELKRKKIALDFAQKFNSIIVLKGFHSLIADPGGEVFVNSTGNVGMATAGSGDVLTGITAAMIGQGIEPIQATRFAVYLHGLAADLAIKKKPKASLIAMDIVEYIPTALNSCINKK